MSYKTMDRGKDAPVYEFLASSPKHLKQFADFAKKEFSLENLEAYLLLQFIDSRARRNKPVVKEYALFMTEYMRTNAVSEVNVGSPVKKLVNFAALRGQDGGVRQSVLLALAANMSDTMSRFEVTTEGKAFSFPKLLLKRAQITESEIWDSYQMVRQMAGKGPADTKWMSHASGTGVGNVFAKFLSRF